MNVKYFEFLSAYSALAFRLYGLGQDVDFNCPGIGGLPRWAGVVLILFPRIHRTWNLLELVDCLSHVMAMVGGGGCHVGYRESFDC